MKIVVNTPSGNVGRAVCAHLLDAGVNVIGLARHPDKLADLARRGAKIRQGALEDEAFVVEATRGVDALFWVTPTDYRSGDLRASQNRVGTVAATAVRTNCIPRVVNLSSVGAQLRAGTGPVSGLHDVEMLLDAAAPNLTHLRPAYFFENYLWQLDAIRHAAQVFLPVAGSIRIPMVATRDVARAAADRLLDATWVGRSVWDSTGRTISPSAKRPACSPRVWHGPSLTCESTRARPGRPYGRPASARTSRSRCWSCTAPPSPASCGRPRRERLRPPPRPPWLSLPVTRSLRGSSRRSRPEPHGTERGQ